MFFKIVNKWNTNGLAKNKIQTRFKIALNSKMPSCFPPIMFYASSLSCKVIFASPNKPMSAVRICTFIKLAIG